MRRGELVALVGPSGCGKSTLLHIAGLLEQADSGEIWIGGKNGATLPDDRALGPAPGQHGLRLPVPPPAARVLGARERRGAADDRRPLARRWPPSARRNCLVWSASRRARSIGRRNSPGGEQQRVAIARALANKPQLLLADEPTGNLDEHTADEVFGVLLRLVRDAGLGALIATHNTALAARMDRRLTPHEGVVQAL